MRATKILIPMLIVLGMAAPLCAGQILYEDFEGANVGDGLVGNISGWTGSDTPVISNVLLSSGNSLDLSGDDSRGTPQDWPTVNKTFSYAIGNDEAYVFTGTLLVETRYGDYADARLVSSSDSSFVQACLGYGKLAFVMWEGGASSMDNLRMEINVTDDEGNQPYTPVDFKLVLDHARTDCYWRFTGNADWIHAGGEDFAISLASYDTVSLVGHDVPDDWGVVYDGGMDNIGLDTIPAFYVPGDANRDGVINAADASTLAANWLTQWQEQDDSWAKGDFNGDNLVDEIDATLLATNWQTTVAGSSSVPEPSTLALLVCGLLCLLPRRRS